MAMVQDLEKGHAQMKRQDKKYEFGNPGGGADRESFSRGKVSLELRPC